jgi:hypothetical protein
MQRLVRGLLREYDIPCGPGDCKEAALALSTHFSGSHVVFGYIDGPNKARMEHAWVQIGNVIVDPTCGVTMAEMRWTQAPAIWISPSRQCGPLTYSTNVVSNDHDALTHDDAPTHAQHM